MFPCCFCTDRHLWAPVLTNTGHDPLSERRDLAFLPISSCSACVRRQQFKPLHLTLSQKLQVPRTRSPHPSPCSLAHSRRFIRAAVS